jgi:hypothetical protein
MDAAHDRYVKEREELQAEKTDRSTLMKIEFNDYAHWQQ